MDLTVKRIVDVYLHVDEPWRRDESYARKNDGIVLFTSGEIEYHFPHKSVLVKKGDIFFLPGNIPYNGTRHSETVGFMVLDFRTNTPDELERLGAPLSIPAKHYESTLAEFQNALALWQKQERDMHMKLKSFAYSLLAQMVDTAGAEKSVSPTEVIIEYIVNHLGDPTLSLSSLCKTFFISESQLRRNLVKATGYKPNEYILRLRLNRARSELTHTQKPIHQVAAECGFSSPYYFSRCFSEQFHRSPSEFRKSHLAI